MAQPVQVGDDIPPITKIPNETALFLFSAATWNPHRIHYDRDYAHAEGHKDIVVHGSLQANWLVEAMLSWSPRARLTSVSFRNVAPAFVHQSFVAGGRVSGMSQDEDGIHITVDLRVEGPAGVTTTGRGTLHLPGPTGKIK